VNVSMGLSFLRTSPDHGTAYDLAGTGRASADSMEASILLAASMAASRSGNAHAGRRAPRADHTNGSSAAKKRTTRRDSARTKTKARR
jgi:hypothetical protein